MSHSIPLNLQVHLDGAEPYEIGDEIWQQSLADAIHAEADTIADYAGPGLLPRPGRLGRVALRNRVNIEMTAALRQPQTPTQRPTESPTPSQTSCSLISRRVKVGSHA
jgi:hypothetical protein